jgi:hypothetical protein
MPTCSTEEDRVRLRLPIHFQILGEACDLKYGKSWDKSLPYTEFSYNSSYQVSIEMAPYQALYRQQCRTPLFWSQTRESQVFGHKVLRDVEKQVQMVRESLKGPFIRDQ